MTKPRTSGGRALFQRLMPLRAKVELQNRQQQVIVARNEYANKKLVLGRIIGLPGGRKSRSLIRLHTSH